MTQSPIVETDMSEKPRPQSSSAKPAPQNADGTKGASSTVPASKSKATEAHDTTLDILAPAQAQGELGRLAHYRILKVLGRGGMGTVFLAEDPRLNRQIALKVMLPEMAKKKVACDRFKREAQAIAKLEHDHIVTIFDVNEDRGIPYLAMQVLKGMTLDDWLKAGKTLNLPQIMRIGKEVAKGLAAAHACRLVHRDIKPSNIWLDATNKGRVKILDFGLARPTNVDTQLTQDGMILGTPAYMSPEQARGHGVDERCDLFSLGCVLYRLCTGKLPFGGKDPMAMLLAIISDNPPPVAELNPAVPPALATLIQQLLAKKPEDRPASARDVVHALQAIEREWIANAKTTATPAVQNPTAAAVAPPTDSVEPALEESGMSEQELQAVSHPEAAPPAPPRRRWIYAVLGGLMSVTAALMCCLCLTFMDRQGTVNVIAKDGAAKTQLDETGLTVVDLVRKRHRLKAGPQQLPVGGYSVDTTGLLRGLQIEPNQFMLYRGATVDIIIRYVAPPDP